jgi:hypothetical protein
MMDQPTRRTAAPATIHVAVPFISGDSRTELLEGELVFDPADPYAVAMNLDAKSGTVTWIFARDLLAEGLYEPAGNGDVQIWPCLSSAGEAVIIIELCSPEGTALLQAPSRTVHDFVARAHQAVAAGEESGHLSLDDLISQLLAD